MSKADIRKVILPGAFGLGGLAVLVLWLLGLVSSYTMGGFVHLLLVVAIIVVIAGFFQKRRRA